MSNPKFLRTDHMRHSRLGKNRKKKQVWRRARGKHSKIRRKRMGYPVMPTIGYATPRKDSGKVEGKIPLLVHNAAEMKKANQNSIIILARVGARKKLELIKLADEMKIKIMNLGGKKWN